MSKPLTALEVWEFGQKVQGLANRIDAGVSGVWKAEGDMTCKAFGELHQAIRELHDLLEQPREIPPTFIRPPRFSPPPGSDDIPF